MESIDSGELNNNASTEANLVDNLASASIVEGIQDGTRIRKQRTDLADFQSDIDKSLLRQKCKKRKAPVSKETLVIAKQLKPSKPQKPVKILLTHKEKVQDDLEERLIANVTQKRALSLPKEAKALPSGPFDVPDQKAAIFRSFQEVSELLDTFTSFQAKLIGCLCKVYWDGEHKWFYARILNYDPYHKRHYIYYFADSTAEWIDIEEEAMLVARSFVYARLGKNATLWPAMTYWVSPTAVPVLKQTARFYSDGVFVEFFSDSKSIEFAYIIPGNIFPLQDKYMQNKPSKKFDKCLEGAKKERLEIDTVIEEVMKNYQQASFKNLKGKQWLGMRVRAKTHRIILSVINPTTSSSSSSLPSSESDELMDTAEQPVIVTNHRNNKGINNKNNLINPSAFCLGTITQYCPKNELYFVVFDEPFLQPQWIPMTKETAEVIVSQWSNQMDSDETLYVDPVITNEKKSSNSSSSSARRSSLDTIEEAFGCIGSDDAAVVLEEQQHGIVSKEQLAFIEKEDADVDEEIVVITRKTKVKVETIAEERDENRATITTMDNNTSEVATTEKEQVDNVKTDVAMIVVDVVIIICALCQLPIKEEGGDQESMYKCYDCNKCCHNYCLDPLKDTLKPLNETKAGHFITVTVEEPLEEVESTCQEVMDVPKPAPIVKGKGQRGGFRGNKANAKKLAQLATTKTVTKVIPIWKCWECIKCFHCQATIYEEDLIYWQTKKQSPTSVASHTNEDKKDSLLLCGKCLYYYKYTQDYCILCNKLYSGIDTSVLPTPTAILPPAQIPNEVIVPSPDATTLDATIKPPEITPVPTVEVTTVVPVSLPPQKVEDMMVQCNCCDHWIHALCEGIDASQYLAITLGNHPIWGDEYLCPICRVVLCHQLLECLKQIDTYGIFLLPVTESVASNYFDVIRQPMDLSTMQSKCDQGVYKSLQPLREDMELMCYNSLLFNRAGDEYWLLARTYYLHAKDLFAKNKNQTKMSAYGREVHQLLDSYAPPPPEAVTNKRGKKRGVSQEENVEEIVDRKKKLSSHRRQESGDVTASAVGTTDTTDSALMEGVQVTNDMDNDSENKLDGTITTTGESKTTETTAEDIHYSASVSTEEPLYPNIHPDALMELKNASNSIEVKFGQYQDPTSYISPCLFQLTAEDMFYSFNKDYCFVCGGCRHLPTTDAQTNDANEGNQKEEDVDANRWIYCIDCGEAFHTFCVQLPPKVVSSLSSSAVTACDNSRFSWRCLNCKLCELCGEISEKDLDNLIFCECCDRAFHMHCLSPALPPDGLSTETQWFCHFCVKCEHCNNANNFGNTGWGTDLSCCYHCSEVDIRFNTDKSLQPCNPSEIITMMRSSHLGKGLDAFKLLSQVAKIQQERQQIKAKKFMSMKALLHRKLQKEMARQLPYYYMMILWAQIRKLFISKTWYNNATSVPLNTVLIAKRRIETFHEKMLFWIPSRARRYLNYSMRSRGSINHEIDVEHKQQHKIEDLLYNSSQLASLSAAFTFTTDAEGAYESNKTLEIFLLFLHMLMITGKFKLVCSSSDTIPMDETLIVLVNHVKVLLERFYSRLGLSVPRIPMFSFLDEHQDTTETHHNYLNINLNIFPGDVIEAISSFITDSFKKYQTIWNVTVEECDHVEQLLEFLFPRVSSATNKIHTQTTAAGLNTNQPPPNADTLRGNLLQWLAHSRYSLIAPSLKVRYEEPPSSSSTPAAKPLKLEFLSRVNEYADVDQKKAMKPGAWAPGGKLFGKLLFHAKHEEASTQAKVIRKLKKAAKELERNIEIDEVAVKQTLFPKEALELSQQLHAQKLHFEQIVDQIGVVDEVAQVKESAPSVHYDDRMMVQDVLAGLITAIETQHSNEVEQTAASGRMRKKTLKASHHVSVSKGTAAKQPRSVTFSNNVLPLQQRQQTTTTATSDSGSNVSNKDATSLIEAEDGENQGDDEEEDNVTIASTTSPSVSTITPLPLNYLDPRMCIFCGEQSTANNLPLLGRMLPYNDGLVAHINCLLWCPEVTITKSGHIQSAYASADKYSKCFCYFCHKKGATVICQHLEPFGNRNRRCKRMFHVQCAQKMKVILLQVQLQRPEESVTEIDAVVTNNNNGIVLSPVRYWAFCPAHGDGVIDMMQSNRVPLSQITVWKPSDAAICLLLERNDFVMESESMAKTMVLRRTDKMVRMGAVSIFALGHMHLHDEDDALANVVTTDFKAIDTPVAAKQADALFSFSTPTAIFPIGFRMSRIYWSMVYPNTRTGYIFEILHLSDVTPDNYDAEQINYIYSMLQKEAIYLPVFLQSMINPDQTNDNQDNSNNVSADAMTTISFSGPLFKVTALDRAETPLFSRYLPYLHYTILQSVDQANQHHYGEEKETEEVRLVDRLYHKKHVVFGMNYDQFFGLALPFTRHALEMSSDSWITMILPSTKYRYQPRYFLPSQANLHSTAEKRLMGRNTVIRPTLMGASRADPMIQQTSGNGGGGNGRGDGTSHRMTKILTKVATYGDDSIAGTSEVIAVGGTANSSSATAVNNEDFFYSQMEHEHTQSQLSSLKKQYYSMTLAYLRNSNSKLIVRKSRIHGWGLFTKQNVSRDEIIVEYIGEKIRQSVADKREKLYEEEGFGSCYLFRLDKDDIIDATRTGGMARFINHCCEPNAYAKILSCPHYPFPGEPAPTNPLGELKHIVIMAARNIQEGEEVTYDYKFPIEDTKLKCYCGAPRCSGSMN